MESNDIRRIVEEGIRSDIPYIVLFGTDVKELQGMPSHPKLYVQHPGRFDWHRVTNNLSEALDWYNAWSDFP